MYKPVQSITMTDNGGTTIDLTTYHDSYYLTGTLSLSGNWGLTATGTPREGMRIRLEYKATTTLGAFTITILGTAMPTAYAAKKVNIDCYYNGTAWVVDYTPAFDEADIITTAMIVDDAITTAKINAKAITTAEMADLADGKIYIGSAGNLPVAITPTGDVTITNAGVMAIGTGVVVDADIHAAAAISTSKLAASADIAKLANVLQTELEFNHDVTAGTAAANKTVVLGATSKINQLDITAPYFNGAAVSATAAEINKLSGVTTIASEFNTLAGVTAGTALASKAVVLDANKKISDIDITALKLNGTAVTATATEVNKLAGCTASVTELNLLTGMTSLGSSGLATYTLLTGTTVLTAATIKAKIICDTTAGGFATSLPQASTLTDGQLIEFSCIGHISNAATIAPYAGDILNTETNSGPATLSMAGYGKSYTLILKKASSTWQVVNKIV
jgi:hypothetical protein